MLENDSDDRVITSAIMAEFSFDVSVKFFSSGEHLLRTLTDREEKPVLIIVDQRTNNIDENSVLKQLKSGSSFNHIPVVVLGELSPSDTVDHYYREGASTFITKPSDSDLTRKKIKTFFEYWLEVAEV
jgi:DNA-binding NtrC family response regulator